jgi:hypothetical protein
VCTGNNNTSYRGRIGYVLGTAELMDFPSYVKSRDSSVGIALGYGLDDRGFESQQGLGIFLFTTMSRLALMPTQPPIQWVPGVLSLGVKRPGREADHSPPSSAGVKNAWSYTSTHQYAFKAWCSVEAQGQHYFTLGADWIRGILATIRCRGSSVGYGLESSRARVPAWAGNFSLHHRFQTGSGANPASYTMVTRGFSLGIKWQGRESRWRLRGATPGQYLLLQNPCLLIIHNHLPISFDAT